jgi:hypothetical protein
MIRNIYETRIEGLGDVCTNKRIIYLSTRVKNKEKNFCPVNKKKLPFLGKKLRV